MFLLNLFYTLFTFQYMFINIYCEMNKKFFRKDYVLFESTDSLYKIHPERKSWHSAKEICEAEGASLFYPDDENEAQTMIQYWKSKFAFDRIFIGISTPYSRDIFETVDGKLLGDVYDKWSPTQPDNNGGIEECVTLDQNGLLDDFPYASTFPFICKKRVTSVEWNLICDIPDRAYAYVQKLGRCYKLYLTPKKWSDAYAVCRMEQSYLAIINSDVEAEYLSQLIIKTGLKNDTSGVVHLGFKKTNGWRTTSGLSLNDSGYQNWANGQPDGGNNSQCGSMFNNGLLNDLNCDEKAPFICEHEIDLLKNILEERFGNNNE